MSKLYFLLVNFRSTSDSSLFYLFSISILSPLLSPFCGVPTQIDLGCTKLILGLLYGIFNCLGLLLALCVLTGSLLHCNPILCGESLTGVFNILGLAPFGVTFTTLLTYCCSGVMCGSNSLSTPWTSGTVSPLALTKALVATQKSSISLIFQKLTEIKSVGSSSSLWFLLK